MSLPADPRKVATSALDLADKVEDAVDPEEKARTAKSFADEVILATAGYDHTIKFWQAHTGQCVRTLQHADSQVNAMEISPDGEMLAAAGYQHIRMFDVQSNSATPVVNYEGVTKNVLGVGFHESGRWMYSGGEDGTAKIWDLRMRNLQCQRCYQTSNNCPVNSVALHPNQQDLLLGDQNGTVHLWNLRSDSSETCVPEPGSSIQSVSIDPQAKFTAAVTNKGNCYVGFADKENKVPLSPSSSQQPPAGVKASTTVLPCQKIAAHKRYALKCKFSPDSSMLVTSSADQTCKIWRMPDLSLVSELTAQDQRWVWDIAFSADSQYLFTASSDNFARLWSLPNQSNNFTHEIKRVYKENGHQKAITCLAFRDGVCLQN